ncbi:MAG: hypothetical protein HYS25_00450 [Ignavibacteriales bacterium]|nr:hypothetical protein [Ignavibacteriales bacterium]
MIKKAEITCKVLHQEPGLFFYRYAVLNDKSSNGKIFSFDIDVTLGTEALIDTTGLQFYNIFLRDLFSKGYSFWERKVIPVGISHVPNGWDGSINLSTLRIDFSGFPEIEAGNKIYGFEINCIGLPAIRKTTFSIAKDIVIDQLPSIEDTSYAMTEEQMDSILSSLDYNSFTVGPNIFNENFGCIEIIDSVISYTNRSFVFGWINQEAAKNKYETYLTNARASLQQGDSLHARVNLENILREVDIDSSGAITSEAYALLRYNTEYLLAFLPEVTEPRNDLTAKASAEVTTVNGVLQYSYTITNEAVSSQSAANIYVEDTTTSTTSAPVNWRTEKVQNKLDRFYTAANPITAGTTQSGYTVTSNSLPVIGKVYVLSERFAVDTTDIKTNSYEVTTVVPSQRPAQINASAFIDSMISYNNRAYALGWMQYYWVRDNNYYQLNNAKTMINMNVPASAVVILTAFEGWLDTCMSQSYFNKETYGLLKYNSIYLREKLSGQ